MLAYLGWVAGLGHPPLGSCVLLLGAAWVLAFECLFPVGFECFGGEQAVPFDGRRTDFERGARSVNVVLLNVAVCAVFSMTPPAEPLTITGVPENAHSAPV